MGNARNNRAQRERIRIKKIVASLEDDYRVYDPRGRIHVRFKPGVRETILPTLEAEPTLDVKQLAERCAIDDPRKVNSFLGICELATEVKQAYVYRAINLWQASQVVELSFKEQCDFVWSQIPPEDESDPFRFFDPLKHPEIYKNCDMSWYRPERYRICDTPLYWVYSGGSLKSEQWLRKKYESERD